MSDFVKLYNPANASALSAEQIQGLQNLTTEQIGQLAKAYPNSGSAYLLIIDGSKPAERQLPALSTFQNLYNLRTKNNLKNFVAYGFKGVYRPQPTRTSRPLKREILDLSDQELLNLAGFRTGVGTTKEETIPPETVTVTKVKEQAPKKRMGRPPKNTNPIK